MLYKKCFTCEQIKPTPEFSKDAHIGDGYMSNCKPCHRTKQKEAREAKPLYTSFYNGRQRCRNDYSTSWHLYGARGIRWHLGENYDEFWAIVRDEYHRCLGMYGSSEVLTLERIDVNGHYEMSNVTFVPKSYQARNRRDSVMITFRGRTECVGVWARELGIHHDTIYNRLARGWDPVEALVIAPLPLGERRI